MKNKLIIGRYLPTQSLIHELDPRAKLIFVFLFIITIFFAHSFTTFAWLLLIILAIMICAKIKLWFLLKGLTPIFIFLIFTFCDAYTVYKRWLCTDSNRCVYY